MNRLGQTAVKGGLPQFYNDGTAFMAVKIQAFFARDVFSAVL